MVRSAILLRAFYTLDKDPRLEDQAKLAIHVTYLPREVLR